MKKLFKKATITVITAAILCSIIPMKSHAVEASKPHNENTINQLSTQSSLQAPPILQGRAVNKHYSQMPKPIVEAFSNEDGTGTGYLDVSWEPVEGVTNYQVILFNGSIHSYWDVAAEETSWTSKGKGMFPTAEQIDAGQINFRRDGSGTEFSVNPSTLYKKAYEINGSLNYSVSHNYYIRVTAVHEDGASPISYSTTTMIPLETSNILNGIGYKIDDKTGYVQLDWEPVDSATGYKLWIFNGKEYKDIDLGHATNWSSAGKGIWPTFEEVEAGESKLHLDGTGSDLQISPSSVYNNAGYTGSSINDYSFKVTSYNESGNTSPLSRSFNINTFQDTSPVDLAKIKDLYDQTVSGTSSFDYTDKILNADGEIVEVAKHIVKEVVKDEQSVTIKLSEIQSNLTSRNLSSQTSSVTSISYNLNGEFFENGVKIPEETLESVATAPYKSRLASGGVSFLTYYKETSKNKYYLKAYEKPNNPLFDAGVGTPRTKNNYAYGYRVSDFKNLARAVSSARSSAHGYSATLVGAGFVGVISAWTLVTLIPVAGTIGWAAYQLYDNYMDGSNYMKEAYDLL